jgi:branched-chain amino acid transport system permease protein
MAINPMASCPFAKESEAWMLGHFLNHLFNGVVLGLLLTVIALGFSLVLGVMEVVNFAHGVLFAIGAYLAFALVKLLGFWWALLISPILVAILGMILESGLIKRIYSLNPLYGLLLTFSIAMGLEGLIKLIWGPMGYSIPAPPFAAGFIDLGFVVYSKYRFIQGVLALFLILALWLFLEKTTYGAVIKAGTISTEMVMALGKNLPRLRTFVFGMGSFLAGIAGVLTAPMWGIRPGIGTEAMMPALVVVVVGGMGSLYGSIIAGQLVGIVTGLTVMFYPRLSDLMMYLLMLVVFLARPRGLMGTKSILEE